jgi:hypothetical protein
MVPLSELQAMQYLHNKLGWRFHESFETIETSCSFLGFVPRPTSEQVREARLQILTELGLKDDSARDPTMMVRAETLFPVRVPAPPAPKLKMPRRSAAQIDPRDPDREFALGDLAYMWWQDIEAAKKHFHSAAHRGHARAQHRLATIYSEERAYSVAIRWCRLAAWQGRLPEAQYDLARMYYYGPFLPQPPGDTPGYSQFGRQGLQEEIQVLLLAPIAQPVTAPAAELSSPGREV